MDWSSSVNIEIQVSRRRQVLSALSRKPLDNDSNQKLGKTTKNENPQKEFQVTGAILPGIMEFYEDEPDVAIVRSYTYQTPVMSSSASQPFAFIVPGQ
jgi:hypothetical protein